MHVKPSQRLYSTVYSALVQLLPDEIDSRITNRALLMIGIFGARSVQSGRIAAYIPIAIQKMSLVRRLERFLDNGAVRVRAWYEPVARSLIHAASLVGEVALVLDSTKVSGQHRLIVVGIAFRQRVIPAAWTWVRTRRGHSSTSVQLALLSYVRSLIPDGVWISLVGDCEFGHMPILLSLHKWGWDYVLRQSGHQLVALEDEPDWRRLDTLLSRRGDWRFVDDVCLTASARDCQESSVKVRVEYVHQNRSRAG